MFCDSKIRTKSDHSFKFIFSNLKRAYSQLNMKERRTETLKESGKPCRNKGCLLGTIEEAFERFTDKQQSNFDAGLPMGFADYANQIKPFVDIVCAENFHLVDGENLVQNPNYEWGKLLDFLEVEKDHFKFYKDEEKGFPCLDKPIKHCLNTAKGTSRKTDVRKEYANFTNIWDGLYKPTVLEMINFFKICDKIDEICCEKLSDENSSFSWIHRYACTDI
ncbi:unnamed protein product [Oikopleura dioica]|uniref:Sulfotransferase n=1 Tax=Oikopleura dioica TaxID=34765 RepID=E4YHI6_OIKDI|nr:unnamed protein product [Oikopleura dioica]